MKIVDRNCPFCDIYFSEKHKLCFGTNDWTVIKCPKCRFVYLNKSPYTKNYKKILHGKKAIMKKSKKITF